MTGCVSHILHLLSLGGASSTSLLFFFFFFFAPDMTNHALNSFIVLLRLLNVVPTILFDPEDEANCSSKKYGSLQTTHYETEYSILHIHGYPTYLEGSLHYLFQQ
jgi:hypothetical protein